MLRRRWKAVSAFKEGERPRSTRELADRAGDVSGRKMDADAVANVPSLPDRGCLYNTINQTNKTKHNEATHGRYHTFEIDFALWRQQPPSLLV